MKKSLILTTLIALTGTLAAQAEPGKREAFPKCVPVLTGSPVEGFTIGSGTTAYSSSIDGSIYKVDLRSGEGEVLVAPEDNFDVFTDCYKLGMRVDSRSNYLYVAGCFWGNAYVFDADTGEELANIQVTSFGEVINDIALTRTAVYFTNFSTPYIHRLPLSANGQMIAGEAPLPIPMQGDDNGDPLTSPLTGHADRIAVEPPLEGFIYGIVMHQDTLYILTPGNPEDPADVDRIQVVALDKALLHGTLVGTIVDSDLDGVASGAMLGGSLYVNNARYRDFPQSDTKYSLTRLNRKDVSPLP